MGSWGLSLNSLPSCDEIHGVFSRESARAIPVTGRICRYGANRSFCHFPHPENGAVASNGSSSATKREQNPRSRQQSSASPTAHVVIYVFLPSVCE